MSLRNLQSMSNDASPAGSEQSLGLRVGEWVEVRPLEEILATLDQEGCLDALPFMPEMAQHCGGRFTVFRVAHKTCDNIESYHNRRMKDAVHLELRCDGSAHGGCQAKCLFFWKEAWLRRVSGPKPIDAPAANPVVSGHSAEKAPARCNLAALHRATRHTAKADDGEIVYRCQST